jgi:hypothetical protein
MPSGRDSFRRNRVAPFVLLHFTTPNTARFILYGPNLVFIASAKSFAAYRSRLPDSTASRQLRPRSAGVALLLGSGGSGRFVYFFNRGDPYRLVLEVAAHADVLRRESSGRGLWLENIHALPNPQSIFRALSHTLNDALFVRSHIFGHLAVCSAMRVSYISLPGTRGIVILAVCNREQRMEERQQKRRDR